MKFIIGLGNIGLNYTYHRHNIGFMANQHIIQTFNAEKHKKKHLSIIFKTQLNTEQLLIAYPQTFMNQSGRAVQSLMSYYKVKPENIMVICDDFDLPLGVIRLRERGSAGTHNGLKSIIQEIGMNFPRLRVGIGPLPSTQDVSSFVLSNFTENEIKALDPVFDKVTDTITKWITQPFTEVQQFSNSK